MSRRRDRPDAPPALVLVLLAGLVLSAAGCGKKGPPLPPLVRTPAPPGSFAAERIGERVSVHFTVPAANTDGTRPANLRRVDVYAFTGDGPLADRDVIRYATKIAEVAVKAPRDPDAVIEPDEPVDDMERPEGSGLDQGATATVQEAIAASSYLLVDRPPDERPPLQDPERPRPLVAGAPAALLRTYVAVGVTTRGRPGAFSARAAVPLSPPPPAPLQPSVHYDETAVTVEWPAPRPQAAEDGLASRWLGTPLRSIAYHVYDVTGAGAGARLTAAPLSEGPYRDTRMDWGAQRCYGVRAVEIVGGVAIESEPSPRACVTLTDTFAPAAPAGLTAVGTEGAVNLIWDADAAPDLAGYIVLRGPAGGPLAPITPAPIRDTNFRDTVAAGVRWVYAVEAVDRAGNASEPSSTVEEAAR